VKGIFTKGTLLKFWRECPEAEQYLKTWYSYTMASGWTKPNDVRQTFAGVSLLKNGRAVFNIKGNSFRLVVKINYERQWVFIRFIGTHEEYDKIDANTI